MIVEDDQGVRDILKIIFERAGYEVWVDVDGKFIYKESFPLPDIFLMDRYLSGMDGLEICRQLKNQDHTKNVPVVMISASPDLAQKAIKAGADDFVEKPFDVKSLLGVIEKHTELSS